MGQKIKVYFWGKNKKRFLEGKIGDDFWREKQKMIFGGKIKDDLFFLQKRSNLELKEISFGSKSKEKPSPRSYSIQFERKARDI